MNNKIMQVDERVHRSKTGGQLEGRGKLHIICNQEKKTENC